MPRVAKSILINATPEVIFALIIDPERAHAMNPDLTVLSYKPSEVGGFNTTWEYLMAGMKFNGASKVAEFDAPNRLVNETIGSIPSRWVWQVVPKGESTRVLLAVEYTMPGSFLGALLNKLVIERQNEKSAENQLINLKRLAEK